MVIVINSGITKIRFVITPPTAVWHEKLSHMSCLFQLQPHSQVLPNTKGSWNTDTLSQPKDIWHVVGNCYRQMPLAVMTPPFRDLWTGPPKKIQLSRFNYADTDLMGGQINYSTDVLWSVSHTPLYTDRRWHQRGCDVQLVRCVVRCQC